MKTAIYIGSGADVVPILVLQQPPFNVKRFVFIESQPQSKYGHLKDREYARPEFLQTFRTNMSRIGFSFSRECKDDNFVFVNRKLSTTVTLWCNRAFPFQGQPPRKLVDQMESADTLVVCGHIPHKSVLHWMKSPTHFVTNSQTVLCEDDEEISPFAFSTWLMCLLPPRSWWCKEWQEHDVPKRKQFFRAQDLLSRAEQWRRTHFIA